MLKTYTLKIALAALAVGATPVPVSGLVKTSDGPFLCTHFGIAAFDANGALIPNPNVTLKFKKGGASLFADETHVCTLQRGDAQQFKLPKELSLAKNDEMTFIATNQGGSTVTTLHITLIGDADA